MTSRSLIDEPPILVLPSLAILIGLNEAIVLQQIHYWINNLKLKAKDHKGKRWVYNSIEKWQSDNFPFWSYNTVARTIKSLEKKGILLSAQLSSNRINHVKYYTIDYIVLDDLFQTIRSNWVDRSTQFERIGTPKLGGSLTETTQRLETETAKNLNDDDNEQNMDINFAPIGAARMENLFDIDDVSMDEETLQNESWEEERTQEEKTEDKPGPPAPIIEAPPPIPKRAIDYYPGDVREYVSVVAECLHIEVPLKIGTKGKKVPDAFWIKSARELRDACGEVRGEAVLAVYRAWSTERARLGREPFSLTSPKSFVNLARLQAGKMTGEDSDRLIVDEDGGFY